MFGTVVDALLLVVLAWVAWDVPARRAMVARFFAARPAAAAAAAAAPPVVVAAAAAPVPASAPGAAGAAASVMDADVEAMMSAGGGGGGHSLVEIYLSLRDVVKLDWASESDPFAGLRARPSPVCEAARCI